MSIVNSLDRVTDWLREHVAEAVRLKPMDFGSQTLVSDYELVEPAVFCLYIPTEATKPPEVVATTPSICVQVVEGDDDLTAGARTLKLRLSFSAWDPGLTGWDIFTPTDEPANQFGWRYRSGRGKPSPPEAGDDDTAGVDGDPESAPAELGDGDVVLTHEGWRDVWNFVDTALRVIESAESIGGLPVNRKDRIKFGVFSQDDGIADFYPFWFAWVELSVTERIIRSRPEIDDYL